MSTVFMCVYKVYGYVDVVRERSDANPILDQLNAMTVTALACNEGTNSVNVPPLSHARNHLTYCAPIQGSGVQQAAGGSTTYLNRQPSLPQAMDL
jgi:hypothetical protein